jgi:hypothetical protein
MTSTDAVLEDVNANWETACGFLEERESQLSSRLFVPTS